MSKTTTLTVASYNIHKGVGTDRRLDPRRTIAVIAETGAEIIALQEVDRRFGERAGMLELEVLHHEHGLVRVPIPGAGPSHGWHGNLLLLRDASVGEVHHIALPGLEPRGAIITDFEIRGVKIRVIAAHFGLLPSSRRAQSRVILERLADLEPLPTVMMGDLNEWRNGPGSSLAHLTKHFDPAPALRSFPSRFPLFPLDRILVGTAGELKALEVHDTPLARRASDHLPIKAKLVLRHVAGSAR